MCDKRAPTIVLTVTVGSSTYVERIPFDDNPDRFDANAKIELGRAVKAFLVKNGVSDKSPWRYTINAICANCNKNVFDDEVTGIFDMPGYLRDAVGDSRYPDSYVAFGIVVINAVKNQIIRSVITRIFHSILFSTD